MKMRIQRSSLADKRPGVRCTRLHVVAVVVVTQQTRLFVWLTELTCTALLRLRSCLIDFVGSTLQMQRCLFRSTHLTLFRAASSRPC